MNNITLCGFLGFISCGKNTASNFLIQDHGYTPFAFADALKDTVSSIFGWDRTMVEGERLDSRQWREEIDTWWAKKLDIPHLTPRWALQNVGTLFRDHFDENIWVMNVERRLSLLPSGSKAVITDARFPNEIGLIRKFGGNVFRVKRGPEPEWYQDAILANGGNEDAIERMNTIHHIHKSEWGWIGEPIDVIIENNGSLDDLRDAIEYHQ